MLCFDKHLFFFKETLLIASTHLTTGAAVGVLSYRFLFKSGSIWGVIGILVIGTISHFFLDMIPHTEEELYNPDGSNQWMPAILSMELVLTFLAVYFCAPNSGSESCQNFYLMAGMIGGALPDIPRVLMDSLKVNWRFLQAADGLNSFFHTSLHTNSFWQGFIPQIVIFTISLTILYFFKLRLVTK